MSSQSLQNQILLHSLNVKLSNKGYVYDLSLTYVKIKAEFAFHNLKMYPYDNDEFDEEERALNAQIRVYLIVYDQSSNFRTKSPSPSSVPRKL